MDLFKKILDPFQGQKSGEYKDISKESQRVASAPPSDLLLYARDIAGNQIQKNMEMLNHCRWIRFEHTYPAFDNMCFVYRNKVFSVVIDIQDEEGKSYLPEEYIKRQLRAAECYNLIPCKFPVVASDMNEPEIETVVSKTGGWNLFRTDTEEAVFPGQLATMEEVLMSDWELHHYGIRFVIKYLKSKSMKSLNFQDTLEVDPQVWFEDDMGRRCWAVVRTQISNGKDIKKPKKIDEIIRRCFKHDGYFIGVGVTPVGSDVIYRGGKMNMTFVRFEKIHSVM